MTKLILTAIALFLVSNPIYAGNDGPGVGIVMAGYQQEDVTTEAVKFMAENNGMVKFAYLADGYETIETLNEAELETYPDLYNAVVTSMEFGKKPVILH